MKESDLPILHHQDHREWLSKLNFYQDEIRIFQNDLSLLLYRHPDYLSVIEHMDEYRNIFLKKLERIDLLRHQIILQEKQLSQDLKVGTDQLWDHATLRQQLNQFITRFEEVKLTFKRFVSRNK